MLRHLILALFLIGLTLPSIAAPAAAADAAAMTDCHTMPVDGGKPGKMDHDGGPAGHVCIGCIANVAQPMMAMRQPAPPTPPHPRPMIALAGADIAPSIPPPRA